MFDFSQIDEVRLGSGAHASPSDGLCFMEMAAWFAGEDHSDKPNCACPVLGAYGICLNDSTPADLRDRLLKPLVPQVVGTRDKDSELKRAQFLAMWATNKILPITLKKRGFVKGAKACEQARTISEAHAAANANANAANAAADAAANAAANANAAYSHYAANAAAHYAAACAAHYAAACAAACAAADVAYAEQIWTTAAEGLRQAILIGRHEGLMIDSIFAERRENLRKLACAGC